MYRLIALLFFLPAAAAADWSPQATLFTYDTAFEECRTDPDAPDLAARCDTLMRGTFVLKRAVFAATQACLGQDLATCAAPFEDEGLPAIAATIAAGTGCENTDLTGWHEFVPFPQTHCAPLIADILIDEGVVPLWTQVECDREGSACVALAQQQQVMWSGAILELENGPLNDRLISDLIRKTFDACRADVTADQTAALNAMAMCESDGMARLWADLVSEQQ